MAGVRASSIAPAAWRVEPQRNIIAGVMAAVVTLPLSMGLGALAVAPLGPEYVGRGVYAGLYAAAFLGLISVIAGARGVAIYAPRSLVSFMIASVCADLVAGAGWLPRNDPEIVMAAVFLTLALAGVFQLAFGLARLAQVVKFIPSPVMAGFQNAAAVIITLSQLHLLLGLTAMPALRGWPAALPAVKPLAIAVGLVTLALVFLGPRITRRVPPLLIGLVGGTLLHYALAAAGFGTLLGATLGDIPARLPDGHEIAAIVVLTQLPGFVGVLPSIVAAAATIAIVASLDILISAKVLENLSGQRGNSTRELLCIGTANSIAPLFGGIAGSISLASSTANYASGGRNSLSLLTHALLFLLMVPLLAPVLGFIPRAVIGALVVYTGLQLFDRWTIQLVKLFARRKIANWQNAAVDLAVIGFVTVVALAGEVAMAVAAGVAITVVIFTLRMSRGVIRSVRYGTDVQSRRARDPTETALLQAHGRRVLALELEGPMFFASAEMLYNRIDAAIAEDVRFVVLDLTRVTEVDSTGARILLQACDRMKNANVALALCGHEEHPQTASLLRDHGVAERLTSERLFPDMDRALEWAENRLLAGLKSEGAVPVDFPFELLDIARGLGAAERATLQAAMRTREFAAGETVFEQGEEGDALFLIVRGSASVRVARSEGGDRRLVTFSPGTVFGEMALLDRGTRSATVNADEPLSCYVLDRASFDAIAEAHPRIGMALLANLAREVTSRMRRANLAMAQR
jgi:SulP family sulfate permease